MQKVQNQNERYHDSVMVDEVLEFLIGQEAHLNNQAQFIDATLGTGGHTLALVSRGGRVLGIELDQEMLKIAEKRLGKACPPPHQNLVWGSYTLVNGNFKDIRNIASREKFDSISGIIFDLGISNLQIKSGKRGFSFSYPKSSLDMRIDSSKGPTASDLLNILRDDQLKGMFMEVLDKYEAGKLVAEILKFRKIKRFEIVEDLLNICGNLFSKKHNIHPATKTFLALRMAVNSELENLKEGLPEAFSIIKKGGRLAVISFHSGEDRIVKELFNELKIRRQGILINEKPIIPTQNEINLNPKSRSAKLRIIEKI